MAVSLRDLATESCGLLVLDPQGNDDSVGRNLYFGGAGDVYPVLAELSAYRQSHGENENQAHMLHVTLKQSLRVRPKRN